MTTIIRELCAIDINILASVRVLTFEVLTVFLKTIELLL